LHLLMLTGSAPPVRRNSIVTNFPCDEWLSRSCNRMSQRWDDDERCAAASLVDLNWQRHNGIVVLHLIDNLIGQEAFQPMKQLVERSEFVGIDATNLLHAASRQGVVSKPSGWGVRYFRANGHEYGSSTAYRKAGRRMCCVMRGMAAFTSLKFWICLAIISAPAIHVPPSGSFRYGACVRS
jgi:hypothetical protein